MRTNAPFQYATQNRMVTATDYASLVLRNFSTLINDIQAFGGEDALEPEFGVVLMSVVFEDDVTAATVAATKTSIQDLVNQLSVASFRLKFIDPVTTFVESSVFFEFNRKLTTLSQNTITATVNSIVRNYFAVNTGKFGQAFRRSNLLSLVDAVSPAILSSRMEVKMQQRVTPLLNKQNDFYLRFPVSIAPTDDEFYKIDSTAFVVANKTVKIRNKLKTTKLEVVTLDGLTTVIDNVGSYDPVAGTINIVGLKPSTVIGAVNYIKLSAVPANQSTIAPSRQDIIRFDEEPSFTSAVIVTTT